MTILRLQRKRRSQQAAMPDQLMTQSLSLVFPTPTVPEMSSSAPATDLRFRVDFRVLLGTEERKEEEAVTASKREFPPICHRQGKVCHDLASDEGGSREPEGLI